MDCGQNLKLSSAGTMDTGLSQNTKVDYRFWRWKLMKQIITALHDRRNDVILDCINRAQKNIPYIKGIQNEPWSLYLDKHIYKALGRSSIDHLVWPFMHYCGFFNQKW
jgi:hypothetical protein